MLKKCVVIDRHFGRMGSKKPRKVVAKNNNLDKLFSVKVFD
jgi:hypothetical protein